MKLLGAGDNVSDRYLHLSTQFPGGNAVNVAVFAARMGVHAGYLGVVGNDDVGRHLLSSLAAEHVDVSHVRVGDGPNATADVELRDNDRVFLRSDRTTALFELDDDQLELMRRYDVVHSGYAGTLLPRVPEIAERTKVSFDFGSRFEFDRVEPYLRHLHLACFSGGHLTEPEAEELVRAGRRAGAEHVLVTRGEAGAYVGAGDLVHHQPADLVSPVDTLGAGDAFIAGLLVGLGTGRALPATLAAASAHAAQVCQVHGAFGRGMPFDPASVAQPRTTPA
ncbi:PfkB family carbohydrate kinase [Microbacterium sp.]|uniref:PfkB family carbohydrate kinase n=1 Tax=Microbacterium sp. TaxID=51671 RepID=UPI0028117DF3|nr:PfkB family carbohydrate kinase [Microbacterium sp.]